ncbi:MAG: sugar transferase [Candidatus Electrothrix aestuarii]|uniref:Sugar transferase n=1 Tax=Candidatus Electrothrix aestuarii TaxID=3062594 RepID=A0AAU8LSK8_9BACT|nr:sugar transferase [Candidatus Electrothrix aestuarii]
MLREHSTLLARIHMIVDIFWVILAFVTAYYTKKDFVFLPGYGLSTEPNYYLVLLVAVVVAFFAFSATGSYRPYRTQSLVQIYIRVIKAVSGVLFGTIIALYLLHEHNVSRALLALFASFLTLFLFLSKGGLYYLLRYYRAQRYNTRNLLVIGAGQRAECIVDTIQQDKGSGYRILGCLTINNTDENSNIFHKVKKLGSVNTLPVFLTEDIVDEIIFASDIEKIDQIETLIRFTEYLGVKIHILPDFQLEKIMYQPEIASISIQEFFGHPTLSLSTTPQRKNALLIKSIIDYTISIILLALLSPVFLLIISFIKLTSEGPAFFIQQRCGLYGRTFPLIKFRTMVKDAEKLKATLQQENEADGPVFKIAQDPRITPLGKFLRKTSLDELPQLLNVLMGHMSLVGPRPSLPEEVKKYEPWQRRRLSMKPGLTCIWQVNGRNNINFERWMRLDLEYIDQWSLTLDSKILLKTVKEVMSFHGQ